MALGGLILTGVCLRAWVEPVSSARREAHEVISASDRNEVIRVATISVLGGFRALAADLVWLRAYVTWEKRDATATVPLLRLAAAIDERPLSFWLNGARIMAYDIAAWEMDEVERLRAISDEERKHITERHARVAISHLEQGMRAHPSNAALWIERGNMELNRVGDLVSAAESFRRASQMPGAPFYAARLHAELLRRIGREGEALAWLKELYPKLPKDVEMAAADLVLDRIRTLETELGVGPEACFVADAGVDGYETLTVVHAVH